MTDLVIALPRIFFFLLPDPLPLPWIIFDIAFKRTREERKKIGNGSTVIEKEKCMVAAAAAAG